jgi:putative ABC transport system ATP-binding protein
MPKKTALPTKDTIDEVDAETSESVHHAVRLVNVSRVYAVGDSEVIALNDVSLDVTPGQLVVVSGPSGSGKTTLLNIVGGLDYASSGRVVLMDVPIGDYDETFRATFRLTNTGFVFQSYNLISTLTAVENVMFPMQLSDRRSLELRKDAIKLLEDVRLSDRINHLPWQLSSGEQQRVAMARAMANDPPIIIADEPTANLDAESAEMIRGLLVHLNEIGKTVFVVTHDENIIGLAGARHFRMDKGVLSPNE